MCVLRLLIIFDAYFRDRRFVVGHFRKSAAILTVLFCALAPGRVNAGILWETDLIYDANTNSSPLACCANKDGNGIFVITKTGPKGSFLNKWGDSVLWEIGTTGDVTQKALLKDADGNAIQTNALAVGPGCAMASDRLGNLLTVGVLGERSGGRSIAVISTENVEEPNVVTYKRMDAFSIKEVIPIQDEFILIGGKRGDGLYLRLDCEGKTVQEDILDYGKSAMLTGGDQIGSGEKSDLAVVGLSVKMSTEEPNESSVENLMLIYDANGQMVYEDRFLGKLPSLGLLFPKVCSLRKGSIAMVFYNQEEKGSVTKLWARCYSPELALLWEKEILAKNKPLSRFDVVSSGTGGFVVVAVTPLESLEFYSFNEKGRRTGYAEYKGMVGTPGFSVLRVNNKIISVFEEGSEGSIKELTIKAKVVAFD